MTCPNPLDWGTLVDYWAGDLDAAASDAVEEHLFGCPDCTAAAARVAAVTESLRAALPPVVSRERVEQLRARGARVRENDFLPGDRREVVFLRDADLLIHRLAGLDLTHADRVDFRIAAESTGELIAAADRVPFNPAEGAVLVACQRHYASLPADTVISLAIHTPSAPPRTATYTILHRFE
ncbi:MAG TPA: zf-HC2 domain-containing protein [Polyangia bacterium]|nr:zf-HC2 domain-containing protein [Polyangia bacterium]